MNNILTNLEAALQQARQELGAVQRVGRALTPQEDARVTMLHRVTGLMQEALDAASPCRTGQVRFTRRSRTRRPGNGQGRRCGEHGTV
jgi:excinuclease UvrABC helicase subunit UvrB